MLGSNKIITERNKSNIVIEPYNQNQVNPNSYDITLGNHFYILKDSNIVFSLEDSKLESLYSDLIYIKYNNEFILEPGMCILAHTEEFIGSYKYATLLKARSTFGRLFIDVCPSAGFGDVGYVNRWTLEIKNNSKIHYILKPYMRLGQICFLEVDGCKQVYKGIYNNYFLSQLTRFSKFPKPSIDYMMKFWNPESMLPKIGHDRVF